MTAVKIFRKKSHMFKMTIVSQYEPVCSLVYRLCDQRGQNTVHVAVNCTIGGDSLAVLIVGNVFEVCPSLVPTVII